MRSRLDKLLIAIARLLLDEKLARNQEQYSGPEAESIRAADLAGLIRVSGIDAKRLRRVARELGESEAPLVIAGASIVHSNSLEALMAAPRTMRLPFVGASNVLE